jgi:hypothetical protein
VVIQRESKNTTADEEPEVSANPLILVGAALAGLTVGLCGFGAYYAYSSGMCSKKKKTEPLLEEDKKKKKNKKAENAQTEESDKNDETRAEKEPDSTIKKVEEIWSLLTTVR